MNAISLLLCALSVAGVSGSEGRGIWCYPDLAPIQCDWEHSTKLLGDSGLNKIFPLMLTGGVAHYASDVLPRSALFDKRGDQLEQCCAAAKKNGIEVHVWKVNYNLTLSPRTFIDKMRRAGRTQVNVSGKPFDWLCPSHPENRKLELESMLEVARKYPVDGLHLDYIRYPGRKLCYCDGCRMRFEADSGRPVEDWPEDCYAGGRKGEYNDWRCRQITSLVEEVSSEARMMRPGLKISAAVFGEYPDCRGSRAQDWPKWIDAGLLDFVCPMNYTENELDFARWTRNQVKLTGGRIPLYPGIGATSSQSKLSAGQVWEQILLARSLGAAGFTIFRLDQHTAESVVPEIGNKLDVRTGSPPHRRERPAEPRQKGKAAKAPKKEGRGVWLNPNARLFSGDWESSMKMLSDHGFNMVMPLMLWAGVAHYPSDVLPRSKVYETKGDQLEQCCAAAKRHGMEVHVWKVAFNLETAPKLFLDRIRREGRFQADVDGKEYGWLCPSHPENRKSELESMLEAARKYPIDGLHFDYIRYPGENFCYCGGCRKRFEADSGKPVDDWPKDCRSGARKEEYNDWRCRQIASLVEEVAREARMIRPGLKVSAAVFGEYPDCRQVMAQDWPKWVEAGWLDFVCPMNYTEKVPTFARLVRNQMRLAGGKVPLYPGMSPTPSGNNRNLDLILSQMRLTRELGADGFMLFQFDSNTAEYMIPGIGRQLEPPSAVPPHRSP